MSDSVEVESSGDRRKWRWPRFGRPTRQDATSGFVTGLFSIPEGMAYASIGGFAAPLGLWSGVVPTIVGSMSARTVLMVTTLTSAISWRRRLSVCGRRSRRSDAWSRTRL